MTFSPAAPPSSQRGETIAKKKTELAPQRTAAQQVIAWMIEGQREADIVEALANHFPGTDAAPVLAAAGAHFQNAAGCPSEIVIGWALEAYRDIYRRMMESGDYQGAARVAKELVALASRKQS